MRSSRRCRPCRIARWAAAAALAAGVLIGWSEWVTWRASWQALPPGRRDGRAGEPGETVLVLGFASSADGRVNAIQRWRNRIAVRSADRATARFVFSGAATRAARSEAAIMADHAVEVLGVPREHVVLEEAARSTWENIAYSIPLLADAPSIVIASNTFHARRARRYLAAQAPELAARLRRGQDYRFGELAPLKPVLALYEWSRERVRRRISRPPVR